MVLFNSEGITHPSQMLSRVLAALGFFTKYDNTIGKRSEQEMG